MKRHLRLVVTLLTFLPVTLSASHPLSLLGYETAGPNVQVSPPITLQRLGTQVQIRWHATFEAPIAYFTVERSLDGTNFELLGGFRYTEAHAEQVDFSFVDPQPQQMQAYRVKQVYTDGSVVYSETAFLPMPTLSAFPNPVQDRLTLDLNGFIFGDLKVNLLDFSGRTAWQQVFSVNPGQQQVTFDLSSLRGGHYILQVQDERHLWHQPLIKP